MLSYHVIYYEKFRKVMQQTEKEALTDVLQMVLSVQKETIKIKVMHDAKFIMNEQ